nr:hypothetical protein [uncultured Roseateles sp.]
MNGHLVGGGAISQHIHEVLAIRIRVNDGLAIVAALNDVVRLLGKHLAGGSGHGVTLN